MGNKLTIAIDYDDTFTADCQMWRQVIAEFRRHGHQVICVSARFNDEGNRRELESALPKGVPVLLSNETAKRTYAGDLGYAVDIWIDDCPESIPSEEQLRVLRLFSKRNACDGGAPAPKLWSPQAGQ